MKNMTLKNIPDPLHKALKKQAEANHRSLNQEILALLERSITKVSYPTPDPNKLIAEAREIRKRFKGSLTMEEIDQAKREGRSETEKLIAEIRKTRKRFKGSMTLAEIDKAKREGRE